MRFIVMHKVDRKMEAGEPPSPGIVERMGELVGESLKSGIFLDGAGLHRSARRVRVTARGGASATTEGPYAGENELVASVAMIKTKSMAEATDVAERFAEAAGASEVEIGPVVEAWDLGFMPKPKTEYERFLLVLKGNAETESGASPTEKERSAVAALAEELTDSKVLQKRLSLAPTSKSKRLRAGPKEQRRWIDGPFAESKELIAGFSVLELPTIEEAVVWANRYAEILGDENEVDVRELTD
jgi:hypothetical protein